MVPDELKQLENNDSTNRDPNKYLQNIFNSFLCWFVNDIFVGSFVYKFQHLAGRNNPVSMTYSPFIILEVGFSLKFANHCHLRLRND